MIWTTPYNFSSVERSDFWNVAPFYFIFSKINDLATSEKFSTIGYYRQAIISGDFHLRQTKRQLLLT